MTGTDDTENARLIGHAAQIVLAFLDGDEQKWSELVNADIGETIDALNAIAIVEAHIAHGSTDAVRAHFAEMAVRAEVEQL